MQALTTGVSKTLLIVYHSHTDGTRQMAGAARAGACAAEGGTAVRLVHAQHAGPRDVMAADGYLFATPECLAAMSGLLKDFFDRSYYDVIGQVNGRPYASLICAGTDGSNAARQIARIATGWRLRPVAEPLIVCTRAQSTEEIMRTKHIGADDLTRCRELGAALATGLAMGVF
ncbi:NADPH-dependent FMN reductase family protein [Acidovorax sp. RAC01]|nr:NADPH-dependent FMN reductase family protein [Acidovorax sp. RAC01]